MDVFVMIFGNRGFQRVSNGLLIMLGLFQAKYMQGVTQNIDHWYMEPLPWTPVGTGPRTYPCGSPPQTTNINTIKTSYKDFTYGLSNR